MKVDGFQIKIHGFFALLIAIAVFTAAYKVGQMGMSADIRQDRWAARMKPKHWLIMAVLIVVAIIIYRRSQGG